MDFPEFDAMEMSSGVGLVCPGSAFLFNVEAGGLRS